MRINIINTSSHPLPSYETANAAGMDLRANIVSALSISPMERLLVPTGLFIEIPPGYEAQVRPRSGLALKHGITVLNTPGTIDADYRGEVKVLLVNLGNETFNLQAGDRIAQLVIAKHETAEWQITSALSETSRGAGGYGSTGKD